MRYLFLISGLFLFFTPLIALTADHILPQEKTRGRVLGVTTTHEQQSAYTIYITDRVHEAINTLRQAHHLQPLEASHSIGVVAQRHTDELAHSPQTNTRNTAGELLPAPTITHTGATFGVSHKERLETYGLDANISGENIIAQPLFGTRTMINGAIFDENKLSLEAVVRDSVNAWMHSPQHRANILSPEYTHAGIGASFSGQHIIVTQVFVQQL